MNDHLPLEHVLLAAGVAIAALFPIANPIGRVPAFLSLTEGMDPAERRAQALRAVAAVAAILTVFLLVGRLLLGFLDISLPAVAVIGGLVVGYLG